VPQGFSVLLDAIALGLFGLGVLQHRRASRLTWLLLAFVGLVVVELFNPLVPSLSYGLLGARSIALVVLVVLAVRDAPLSQRDIHAVLWALVLGWSVNVLLAARQWLGAFTGAELRWIEDLGSTYLVGDQVRLLGAAQSNQDFALLAAVALPAVAVLAFRAPPGGRRVALLGLAAASTAVLFGSLVRSGLVGGVVGATVALVLCAARPVDRRRLVRGGIVTAVALWAAAAIAPGVILPANKADALAQRVTSIFSPSQDYAFRTRQAQTWPFALEQIGAHPLGAGPGSAGPLSQSRAEEAPLGSVVPDNGYLLIAVQLGIAGAALFVAMLGALLLELARRARAGNAMAAAAAGSLAATMVAMLAGSYWSLIAPMTVLAVLCGLGLRDRDAL
jgi:O-antigen ligase